MTLPLATQDECSMHLESNGKSCKRLHSESYSLDEPSRHSAKKRKLNPPASSQSSSAFWDNLSRVWLTRNALRELDRRNFQRTISEEEDLLVRRPANDFLRYCSPQDLRKIKRYARRGGPDLCKIRGYRKPKESSVPGMNSRTSSYRIQKRVSDSRASSISQVSSTSRSTSRSTRPSRTETTRSSGPYDRDFQQHLIDYGIYPHAYDYPDGRRPPKPSNWSEIKERLARPRASLSPSKFTEEAHESFVRSDANAFKEKQVTESVISMIEGNSGDVRCVSGGVTFGNFAPLTDGTLKPGNPDRYYGARPEQLRRDIRSELSGRIKPSTQDDLPILPNFLLAAKGPDGSLAVAGRQASYDGALGARAMHTLQTYKQEEPKFDNNAYTLTNIYHGGTLKMFTSHPSKTTNSDRPEYYMTQLRSFALTDSIDTFREGATWFRNGRDWAKEQRENAIRRANDHFTSNVVQSTLNTSFSTICDTSGDESTESVSRESHFSFIQTSMTESFHTKEFTEKSRRDGKTGP
ncbi:conserved hypothetical protein [Talaromyces stipitatus ATCC 10500]|uniref:Uncharacterized protein n=1 Tax=Talaromyces stipitatus (strain ATCC 10500 / CBS 375.48 / QM 6759 / NRRL 1006) TaxID=441959 RepID=B8LX54_TALSN|nr:uncharacterized protein TSTA_061920 [Talaromyces stipitatus ATCC 10500]EED22704.1 conserved hypothetical protein [Talaromyces stipitatus ATCC 10500]